MELLDKIFTTAAGAGISRYIMGTAGFGSGKKTPEMCASLLDVYFKYGGNALDTAAVYGESERTLGSWLESRVKRREDIVLITKGAHPDVSSMHTPRMSADDIAHDLENSLRDLKTDYIDIYYLHRDAINVPVSYIIDTLNKYIKNGSVRALGASNWTAARIDEANAYAKSNGLSGFSFSQICHSAAPLTSVQYGDDTLVMMDDAEYERYAENSIPVMAYSSQALGFYQKYLMCEPEEIAGKSRYGTPSNIARLERIRTLCSMKGISPTAVVGSYLTSSANRVLILPIVSASSPEQLEDTLECAGFELTKEELAFIDGK